MSFADISNAARSPAKARVVSLSPDGDDDGELPTFALPAPTRARKVRVSKDTKMRSAPDTNPSYTPQTPDRRRSSATATSPGEAHARGTPGVSSGSAVSSPQGSRRVSASSKRRPTPRQSAGPPAAGLEGTRAPGSSVPTTPRRAQSAPATPARGAPSTAPPDEKQDNGAAGAPSALEGTPENGPRTRPPVRCEPFIEWKDDRFVVNPRSAAMLDALEYRRIRVVCIAGPYRTGKSFLINQIIGRRVTKGFAVGGTVNACTRGIWMYISEPRAKNAKDGGIADSSDDDDGGTATVYLDSEGLGATDKELDFDAHMFALCALLSSLLILNTQGCITNATLEQLELVVNLTRHVQVTAKGGSERDDEGEELSRHFPDFLWVLRDFSLSLEDREGNPITARQYLEQSLEPQGGTRRAQEKNKIRKTLKSVFPNRDCITVVRPVVDERRLRHLEKEPLHRLRAEFKDQIRALRAKVQAQAAPKRVDGRLINGPALARLAEAYVAGINKGDMPPIRSAWKSVIEIQAIRAVEKAASVYAALFPAPQADGTNVLSSEELAQVHMAARERAYDLMSCVALSSIKPLKKKLEQRISKLWSERKSSNYVMSMQQCTAVAHRVSREHSFDAIPLDSDVAWIRARTNMRNQYLDLAKGPAKHEVGWQFFDQKCNGSVVRLFKHIELLRSQRDGVYSEVKSLKREVVSHKETTAHKEQEYKRMLEERQARWAEERRELMDEYQQLLLKMQGGKLGGKVGSDDLTAVQSPAAAGDKRGKRSSSGGAGMTPSETHGRRSSASLPAEAKFTSPVRAGVRALRGVGHHLAVLLQEMRSKEDGVKLADVRSFLWVYREVFTGKAAVTWMVTRGWAANRKGGVRLGSQLLAAGCFEPARAKSFVDDGNALFKFGKARPGGAAGERGAAGAKAQPATSTGAGSEKVPLSTPVLVSFGSKLKEHQIRRELAENKAYRFDTGEQILYHYVNSRVPKRATRNNTINLTKHAVLVTTKNFIKFEAARVSQCFHLDDVATSVYLGFSKSGLPKVQVDLQDSVSHTIHFVNAGVAVWFAKVLADLSAGGVDTAGRKPKRKSSRSSNGGRLRFGSRGE